MDKVLDLDSGLASAIPYSALSENPNQEEF